MTPIKSQYSLRITRWNRVLLTALIVGLGGLLACNELRARDLSDGYVLTVTGADSLFRTHYDPMNNPGPHSGWKPYNRFLNFYAPRAYPFAEIPVAARFTAFEEKQRARRGSGLDENWQAIGPTNLAGRVLSLAWHPTNTNIIYCGSASGGLWKTTDQGASWTSLTDNLPSLAIGTVALDPNDANVIYIGTGEGSYNIDAVYGAGIFKSTDGGTSWNATGLAWQQSQGASINKIVIDPTNSQIVYAASSRQISGGGVYKSVNGGTSWTRYHTGDVKDLVMHPDSANVLYCAVGYPWGHADNGVFRSENSGVTWTRLSSGLPSATSMGRAALSIAESNPAELYLGLSQTISAGAGFAGMYHSTDAGASWTLQSTTPNMYAAQGWYNIVCKVHPTNPAIVYSSGLDAYKSTDSGVSWVRKSVWSYPSGHSQYAHADHHELVFMPGNPNTIIVGTDGGLFKSTNGGDTWSGINTGLSTFQFYAMDHDFLDPTVAWGGTQDNGTNRYNNSSIWTASLGGDGGYCNVDFTNSSIVYAETQRGSHYKTLNGGGTWSTINSGISGSGAWVTPVEMDPTSATTLITGTQKLYRTVNGGSSWTAYSPDTSSQNVSVIAIAPSNPSRVYFSYESTNQFWRTLNGGTSWTNNNTGLPNRWITRIAVHPTNADLVFISFSGYGTGHCYKSTNGGTSWTNSSTGLPDVPCNDVVIDRNNPNYMYIATDLGVYASTDGGASWVDYSNGIPNVVVEDLSLHPTTGMLRAATHGRGMWETSTSAPSIAIQTPNGGDNWTVGSTQNFTWTTGGVGGNVLIELNRGYPGGAWETIIASTPNDGVHAWTVTGATSTTARARITSVETPALTDESNANFSIVQPTITVVSPNGGEAWVWNTTNTITWTATGTTGPFVIDINRAWPNGSWENITTVSGVNSYNWLTLGMLTIAARVRVSLQSDGAVNDQSNASFSIVQPTITLSTPNGGENFIPGETTVIRWARANLSGTVRVEINRTYPGGTWTSINSAVTPDSLVWTVDGPGSSAARIRVISNVQSSVGDSSNANFNIANPSLALTVPNGGEIWNTGTNQTVRWNKTNISGGVNLFVNRNYPAGSWDPIAVNIVVDTFSWAVNTPNSNNARLRVQSVTLPALLDESNGNFNIGTALELTAPNGGEAWNAGTLYAISFNRYNAAGNVTIELNRSWPSTTWETVATNVSSSSYSWLVTGPPSTTARIRLTLAADTTIRDTSANNFTVNATGIALDYPVGGENWNVGSVQSIAWTRTNAPGNVTVQLARNYGAGTTWSTLTTTAAGNSFNYTVTAPTSTTCRVRVYLSSNNAIGDTCNTNFSIVQPVLTLAVPNGGENWAIGSTQTIRWSRANAAGNVSVQLNRTYPGGSWEILSAGTAADSLQWVVNGAASSNCRVKIYLVSQSTVGDTSAANFTLSAASITVTAPNGGESWVLGLANNITFTRTNATGPATVQLNRTFPGGTWETLDTNVTTNSYSWTASGAASTQSRVRVYLNATPAIRDSSNANFSLVTPSLAVTYPNGGDTLRVGASATITWTRTNVTGAVSVLLNRNYPGGTWDTLSNSQAGSSMVWTVTGPVTNNARFRVAWNSLPGISDESNADVHITVGSLALSAPDGGETYTLGGPLTVRWTRTSAPGNVTVQLNRNYPAGGWENLTTTAAADSFVWTASGAASAVCRVRVRLTADSSVNDVSAGNFTLILRTLALTVPNGGETFFVGNTADITFTRTNATGNVTIALNRTYPGGSWEVLANNVSTSTYSWTVTGPTSANARVRIYLNAETFVGDTSNAAFTIANPSVVVSAPNGGESWVVGASQNITWTRNGFTDNVSIELNRAYPGGTWELLNAAASGSSYAWTVTGPTTSAARVRVISTANSAIRDSSNANFTITLPQITLSNPNGGDVINLGFPYTVRWSRLNAPGSVRVLLKRDYPNGLWETLGTATADSLVWTPAGAASTNARVRVYLVSDSTIGDTSAAAFTLLQPSLTLTSPNGGESWLRNSVHSISWSRVGLGGGVRIDFNANYPAGGWTTLATGQTGNSWLWNITQATTAAARIKITYESATQFGDTSSANFAIIQPQLAVTAPNGGEQFNIGSGYNITFSRTDHPGAVTIQLNRTYPSASWETLTTGYTGSSFSWTASGPATLNARVRVLSEVYTSPQVGDSSNANFRILSPGITIIAPDGGEQLAIGTTSWIRWIRVGVSQVDVLLNRSYPSGSWENIATNLTADSLLWTVNGPVTGSARIKVWAVADHNLNDQSTTNFQILQPSLQFTQPAASDTLAIGYANAIAWSRNAVSGNVTVDINRNYPSGSWVTIGTTPGDVLNWIGTGPATNLARLRVISNTMPSVGDTLDFNIAVLQQSLSVETPQIPDTVAIGQELEIAWLRSNLSAGANVYLSRDSIPANWELLAANVAQDHYAWTVTAPRTNYLRLRVLSAHNPAIGDTTAIQVLVLPEVTITSHNGGTIGIGNTEHISWVRQDAPGLVDVQLNRHYPSGAWETIAGGISGNAIDWTVTGIATDSARFRVVLSALNISDESDGDLCIALPVITVTSPNGGEIYDPNDGVSVQWTGVGTVGNFLVELNTNYPSGSWQTVASNVGGTSTTWTVPNEQFEHGRMRVSMQNRPEISDVSNADFGTQLPGIYIMNPNGLDTLIIGSVSTIRWGRSNATGTARLQLNRAYPGGSWENIGNPTAGDSVVWTVTGPVTSTARFKVFLVFDTSVNDVSDENSSILQPSLTLLAPVAGDSVGIGDTLHFSWQSVGIPPAVSVWVKRLWPTGNWEALASNLSGNSWEWVAAGAAANNARFKITSTANNAIGDTTDGAVRIGTQTLQFSFPAIADTFRVGETVSLQWLRNFVRGNIHVELSRNGTGGPWEDLGTVSGNQMDWAVTGAVSATARLRISRANQTWVSALTPFNLSIVEPHLTLLAPQPDEPLALGRDVVIAWERDFVDEPIDVLVNSDFAGASIYVLRSGVTGDSIHWNVQGIPAGNSIQIILQTAGGAFVEAHSAGELPVGYADINLVTPIGGESYLTGQPLTISWDRAYCEDPVSVQLNRDFPSGTWETLSGAVAETTFTWTVAGASTDQARIRILSTVDAQLGDTTGDAIHLITPALTVTSPVAGERVPVGFARTITWTRAAVTGPIIVYLSRNGGGNYELLASSVNGDSYTWTPSEPATTTAQIRIVSAVNPAVSANSGIFTLASPVITLLQPNGGEQWLIGSSYTIRWTEADHPANVNLELNRNDPGGSWEPLMSNLAGDSAVWTISGSASANARLRVSSSAGSWNDVSNAVFALVQPGLDLTAPAAGTLLLFGDDLTVTWTRVGVPSPVNVYLRYQSGQTQLLGSNLNSDALTAPIPAFESGVSWLVVRTASGPSHADSIQVNGPHIPSLTITAPANDARLIAGAAYAIRWNRYYVNGAMTVEVNRMYPSGPWETLTTSAQDSFVWTPAAGTPHVRIFAADRPALQAEISVRVVQPALQMTEPESAAYRIGQPLLLAWTATELTGAMQLEINRDYPAGPWELLYSGTNSSFAWTIDGPATDHARFRISATEELYFSDATDTDVSFYQAQLDLSAAQESDTLRIDEALVLNWSFVGVDYPVELALRRGAGTWETLAENVSADTYTWLVTGPQEDGVYLRARVVGDAELVDSVGPYAIRPPHAVLSFVWPVEAGSDTVGQMRTIAWQWTNGTGAVRLEVSYGSDAWTLLADSLDATSFTWLVSGFPTEHLQFRVTSVEDAGVQAVSIERILVRPELSIATSGGTWYIGQQRWIQWSRTHYDGDVELELARADRSEPWMPLATVAADSFLWTVTGPATDVAAFRIRAVGLSGIEDTTDVPIAIHAPQITVIEPNGGEILDVDTEIRLRWIADGIASDVAIGLWRGEPVNRLDTLFLSTENDSSEIWTITGPAATGCYLVVLDANNDALGDTSDAAFEIHTLATGQDRAELPDEFALLNAYPNPFNATTTIAFAVPQASAVRLVVFDMLGREVEVLLDERKAAGVHRVTWNGALYSSGTYFVRMTATDFMGTRRVMLLK